jgi:hypothetical protein
MKIQHQPCLGDALLAKLQPARVRSARQSPWASITFSGARHSFVFDLDGAGAQTRGHAFAAAAACEEFDVKDALVADLIVTTCTPSRGGACVTIEALTVEAR